MKSRIEMYKWTSAPPQGRERLKELGETEIVYRSTAYGIGVVYIDPANVILKDAQNKVGNIHDFLDPTTEPVADENGLLPCPHCAGGGKFEIVDEECDANTHVIKCGIHCQRCLSGPTFYFERKLKSLDDAKSLAKTKWNTRAGKY